jgi:HK97 gp10 family phage protein|tara:strand:+ start:1011 stop:1439 length:429 start_codon:yes stop_codon:yes gene_type:complete
LAKSEIKGLQELLKKFKTLDKEIVQNVEDIMEGAAKNIEEDAKVAAPVDFGKLRQGIKLEPIAGKEMGYRVVAKEKYSAFMEFGTGGRVKVPTELKEVAIQFKGKGIREVNIQPRPFLYPAFVKNRKILIKDLKDYLKTLKL